MFLLEHCSFCCYHLGALQLACAAESHNRSNNGHVVCVVSCQKGELDPGAFEDCIFTATATRTFSFLWASQASFDIIKLGVEPIPSVYIGNRFGMYFTDCCLDAAGEDVPCEWLDSNVIRFRGSCAR